VGRAVALAYGFQAKGAVRLVRASITGDLECTEGIFHNPTGDALNADRVQVGGAALLRNGFEAKGAVSLVSTHVGQLVDDEASWPAPGNLRLNGFVYRLFR
jgi:hypothetical protein